MCNRDDVVSSGVGAAKGLCEKMPDLVVVTSELHTPAASLTVLSQMGAGGDVSMAEMVEPGASLVVASECV